MGVQTTLAVLAFGAVAAGPPAVQAARPRLGRLPGWAPDLLAVLGLLAFTAWVYGPLVRGRPPLTWDHNYHLLKVLETEDLLRRGRLFGWSDWEFAGYPANVLYPFAGSLLGAALHALPGVDLARAYAWSLLLVAWAMPLAVYLACRLHLSRLAGVLGGLFAALDPGGWWVGGHFFAMHMGVWGSSLSAAVVLAGLSLVPRGFARGRALGLALPGLVLGLAIVIHPVALLLVAVGLPCMALALLAGRAAPARAWGRALGLGALGGVGACAFWLVPMLAAQRFSAPYDYEPVQGKDLWGWLLRGELFHQPVVWYGASLVGLLLLAGRRDAFSRFVALCVPVAVALSAREGWLASGLLTDKGHGQLVQKLQMARLYYLIGPLGMVAAAHALGQALPRALRRLGAAGWRALPARLAVAASLAWVVSLPGAALPGLPEDPVEQPLKPAEVAAIEHLLDKAAPRVGPGDKLVLCNSNPYDHTLQGRAALRGMRVFKIGSIGASVFKNQFGSEHPEVVERVGGTAMLCRGPPPKGLAHYPLLAREGEFELHAVPHQARAWMEGPGTVEVMAWSEDEIRLWVAGAGPGSQVRLGLAYYDRWQEAGGAPLKPYDLFDGRFSTLPATNGEHVLRYRAPAAQPLGLLLSLACLGAIAFAHRAERRSQPVPFQPADPAPAPPPLEPGSPAPPP